MSYQIGDKVNYQNEAWDVTRTWPGGYYDLERFDEFFCYFKVALSVYRTELSPFV